MRKFQWFQVVLSGAWLVMGAEPTFAQVVGPRREFYMTDDVTLDDGDEPDDASDDATDDMAETLTGEPSLPLTSRRGTLERGFTLAFGATKPWQRATLSLYQAIDAWQSIGLFIGAGDWNKNGNLGLKSYDMVFDSRSFGLQVQRWFKEAEHFGVEGTLGYVDWNGRVTPKGQAEEEPTTEDVLSTGIQASGLYAGLSLMCSWIWSNGLTLDWTILGVQKSYILRLEQSRLSPSAGSAARLGLTSPGFFGLTGVAIGYRF